MTLGVRGIAFDAQGRVALVRHTYVSGWHLPGGGVERGETALDAMVREFREEAEIVPEGPPAPARPLPQRGAARRATTSPCSSLPAFTVLGPKAPDREIAACEFFPLDALPDGTTRGDRAPACARSARALPPDPNW